MVGSRGMVGASWVGGGRMVTLDNILRLSVNGGVGGGGVCSPMGWWNTVGDVGLGTVSSPMV